MDVLSDVIDRILTVCEEKNILPAQLINQKVAAKQTVYDVLKKKQKPGIDFVSKFLTIYADVNGDWLMTGRGKNYLTNNNTINTNDSISNISTIGNVNEAEIKYNDYKYLLDEKEKRIAEKDKIIEEQRDRLKFYDDMFRQQIQSVNQKKNEG